MYKIKPRIKDIDSSLHEKEVSIFYNKHANTNLKLIKSKHGSKGQCFNYATKNFKLDDCEDCLDYIEMRYTEIDLEVLKIDDIAIFFDRANDSITNKPTAHTVQHFGIISYTDNTLNGTKIKSKWGKEGIFEGNLADLPDFYGERVCFYRKKGL